ncbi:MAG: gamma-glutamylcyclotransferase [Wenzhouxiangellaceae bacterium]|nr:gamma-glutamylcyclotransferase [Wenzhouxiangellaceae bacterium]MBS3746737.1 gamma-glutamylcyclotransferase [Wenzhouxiangellaceae bacterium]MBS3823640.1 gamma-glutamylcyclotransferase [Wenzhouxiangellaceae bacterium]
MSYGNAFLYFAYGSNLMSARLKARTPSARPLGRAVLPRFELRWHKVGADSTGKCDVVFTDRPGDFVHGVAYMIRRAELKHLDRVEELGTGYYACNVPIRIGTRRQLARTYRAIPTDPDLKPLDWYKRFVVHGAREHGLPEQYVARLARTSAITDTDNSRRMRNLRIV